MFAIFSCLYPSLIFKVRSLLLELSHVWGYISPAPKKQTRVEMTDSSKHSSLFWKTEFLFFRVTTLLFYFTQGHIIYIFSWPELNLNSGNFLFAIFSCLHPSNLFEARKESAISVESQKGLCTGSIQPCPKILD